ncbi:MAG TPA: glutamate racemase [Steroidobacteraceae bacterium]
MQARNTSHQASLDAPIGVFDSGVGGLTVLRALLATLPHEDFVYLGDTARLPYGTKSPGSIRQYSLQAARLLHQRGVKCLVVACNTASAIALDALTQEFAPVPVLGVLEPGAAAACRATRCGRIAVLATESTVRGGAYQAAIARRLPQAVVTARACPLFVALAEEGWTEGPVVEGVIHRYLDGVFVDGAEATHPDTLLLGCTHFPVLAPALAKVLGPGIAIVDSAATTAASLAEVLAASGLARDGRHRGRVKLLATDGAERFARVGAVFLGRPLAAADVEIVDLAPASVS